MRRALTAGLLLITSTRLCVAQEPQLVAEPVEFMQVCGGYTDDFFVLPGTDVCLSIEAKVRADLRFEDFSAAPSDWSDRSQNGVLARVRAYFRFDARNMTEFGIMRTYMELRTTSETAQTPVFNQDRVTQRLRYAFIQLAGVEAGILHSFYDFWTGYSYGATSNVAYADQRLWLAGYTYTMSNGSSFAAAVEDRTFRQANLFFGEYRDTDGFLENYGGVKLPSFVAHARLARGWGQAQVMAALAQVRYLDSAPTGLYGWALGTGIDVSWPSMWAGKILLKTALQVSYSQGIMDYVHSNWGIEAFDAVALTDGSEELSYGWSIAGGLQLEYLEQFRLALDGSYAQLNQYTLWDLQQWDLNLTVEYRPVRHASFGIETAFRVAELGTVPIPAGSTLENPQIGPNSLSLVFRIEREF
ncbi:Porin omp2a precursor [Pseudovibrio axinellae]|uniref:Porin n=1 Tax=Pseudovibrio axinellae TaxID=989403 RepID=A0A165SZ77_9HYPH|nr:porin [Pseudovibrio axinellae]KZL05057.1 Porin omp2a precursor [Pseudovibrio axinellae]SER66190.1 Porin subfamily protein [Pseudovibrio axinellae]